MITALSAVFRSFTRPYPMRDWLMVLVAVFFVFFAFVSYGVYLYVATDSGAIFTESGAVTVPQIPVTTADLSAVLNVYNARSTAWGVAVPLPPVSDPR